MLEGEPQHVGVVMVAVDLRRYAECLDGPQVELPLLADKATIQTVRILRTPLRPAAADARHLEGNRIATVPLDGHFRRRLAHQLQQTWQQLTIPLDLATDVEPLLAQV